MTVALNAIAVSVKQTLLGLRKLVVSDILTEGQISLQCTFQDSDICQRYLLLVVRAQSRLLLSNSPICADMEIEGVSCRELRPPYYTHIQLLSAYLIRLVEADSKLKLDRLSMPTQEIFLMEISSTTGAVTIKIVQMLRLLKLYVQSNPTSKPHMIWLNHRSFVRPSLTNTLSMRLITHQQRLQAVLRSRILALLDHELAAKYGGTLQRVMGEQLQAVTVLKYLTAKDIRNVHMTCSSLYTDCNSNGIYKALYEARFGRSGFGLELEWKTLFFNKSDRDFM